jgi:hypothetical protein
MTKAYPTPHRAAGILFVDPQTPHAIWEREIAKAGFSEVYIPISQALADAEIQFARQVLTEVLQKHLMLDPVVIGPVNCRMMAQRQDKIGELGLRITGLDEQAYAANARAGDRLLKRRKPHSSHSR